MSTFHSGKNMFIDFPLKRLEIEKALPFPIESGYPIMTSNIEGKSYTLKLAYFKEFIKLFWVHDQKERRVLWNIYEDFIKRDDYKNKK